MRIYSWNVCGLRAAARKGWSDWLARTKPSVFCAQETLGGPEVMPGEVVDPPGYYSYWAPAERKGYSGVATFTRRKAEAHPGIGIERFDQEGRVLLTRLDDLDIYNVYFPKGVVDSPRLQYKYDFYEAFLEHIDREAGNGRNVIFCGDVNTAHHEIDIARPKDNSKVSGFLPEEREYLDEWERHGWVDTFRYFHPDKRDIYSWWSNRSGARDRNVGWRLDYVFVHERLLPRLRKAGIDTKVTGSDHCPVWAEIGPAR
ncbi:MAG: exodeoxyribonuclease III [Dehalococcoidia bacterium]|nr:exodeoxyribonuclease III [Dehalococcoidia bacterium]